MDRRFKCPRCGVKWFIPANQPDVADLTECTACGGELVPFAESLDDLVSYAERPLDAVMSEEAATLAKLRARPAAALAVELAALTADERDRLMDLRQRVAATSDGVYLGRLDSVLMAAAGAGGGMLGEAEHRFEELMATNRAEVAVLVLEAWYDAVRQSTVTHASVDYAVEKAYRRLKAV